MTGPLLSIRDLRIAYGPRGAAPAVEDISFDLARGQAMGVVGESGSGKSTVAAAILGLMPAQGRIEAGTIHLAGPDQAQQDLVGLDPVAHRRLLGGRIGTVFQDPFTSLNPAIPVGRQIAEPLVLHRALGWKAAEARAVELLASLGVRRPADMAAAYPHQLSGGMKQRALIAAAIACEPELLILDEPTTALDVTIEAQILDLLEDLRRRMDCAVLFISHNLGTVRRLCDALGVLYAGRMVEQGPAADLFANPAHPYAKGLLASVPRLRAARRSDRLPTIPGQIASAAAARDICNFAPRCPFVMERPCRSGPQALEPVGPERLSRCGRAAEVAALPWPIAPSERIATPRFQRGDSLLNVVDVRKVWRSRRFPPWRPARELAAVDGVSLAISPGEVLGLVGESGCGKSTLGRLSLALMPPTGGSVQFDGLDLTAATQRELRPVRQAAQIVFQNADSSLNPRQTVGDLVGRPLVLFDLCPRAELKERVAALLERVRLPRDYADRYPHQLSGGEKQRVVIARALATDPKFLFCDEPVSALDVSVQAAVMNLLADQRDRLGIAFLFVSHDIAIVAGFADRIAVMYRGRFCELGETRDVLSPPHHPYTAALLSAVAAPDDAPQRQRILLRGDVEPAGGGGAGCVFQARCPRKIGPICEQETPPCRRTATGLEIHCHLSLAELGAEPGAILPPASAVAPSPTRLGHSGSSSSG